MTVFFYHNMESNEDNDVFLLALWGFLFEDKYYYTTITCTKQTLPDKSLMLLTLQVFASRVNPEV